jgi:hypothetical protein
MANYLTIQQASETTGKSARTIRRLCYEENSKEYITYDEKNRLLIDANYLAQHYPLIVMPQPGKPAKSDNRKSMAMSKDMAIDNGKPKESDNLLHKVAILELELKHREELFYKITQEKERQILEKDRRIEDLNRALLLLGEGLKRDPINTASESTPETVQKPEPEPPKKKRWWPW